MRSAVKGSESNFEDSLHFLPQITATLSTRTQIFYENLSITVWVILLKQTNKPSQNNPLSDVIIVKRVGATYRSGHAGFNGIHRDLCPTGRHCYYFHCLLTDWWIHTQKSRPSDLCRCNSGREETTPFLIVWTLHWSSHSYLYILCWPDKPYKQVIKASPFCHPSRSRMDLSDLDPI